MVLLLLRLGRTEKHVDEFRLVNCYIIFAPFFLRSLLSVSNVAHGRMREDYRANIVIVHLQIWFVVEEAFGEDAAGSDGNWCQLWSARSNVTNGVNSWNIRVLVLINHDFALLVCFDATILKL